jgi:hypothetical protein
MIVAFRNYLLTELLTNKFDAFSDKSYHYKFTPNSMYLQMNLIKI